MPFSYFDTHADTFFRLNRAGGRFLQNECHISLERLRGYDCRCQFFALYGQPSLTEEESYADISATYALFLREVQANCAEMCFCKSFADLQKANAEHKLAAFLSIENSSSLKGDVALLDAFVKKGVRLASLTHSPDNIYGCGSGTQHDCGLTALGRRFIKEYECRGVILDVSHLSFQSFWDLAETATRPFMASHSNSYAVCPNPRNLKDEQFQEIVRRGGYVGLNLYADFLTKEPVCTLDDVLRHAEHFLELGGARVLGLGGDLDGIDRMPQGVAGVEDVYKIGNEMLKRGFSEALVHDMMYENGARFLEKML